MMTDTALSVRDRRAERRPAPRVVDPRTAPHPSAAALLTLLALVLWLVVLPLELAAYAT